MSPATVKPFDRRKIVALEPAALALTVPSNSTGTSNAPHSASTPRALRTAGNPWIDEGRRRTSMEFPPMFVTAHLRLLPGIPTGNRLSDDSKFAWAVLLARVQGYGYVPVTPPTWSARGAVQPDLTG